MSFFYYYFSSSSSFTPPEIDMCVKQPCDKDGTKECINRPDVTRHCVCKTGFSGVDCQHDKGIVSPPVIS